MPLVYWQSNELHMEVPKWQLPGPVGTVCVIGDDRVGKSTMLTLWAQLLQTEANVKAFQSHWIHRKMMRYGTEMKSRA